MLFAGFVQNSILVEFAMNYFAQVVQPYNSTGTATAWNKSRFILLQIKSLCDGNLVNNNPCLNYVYDEII